MNMSINLNDFRHRLLKNRGHKHLYNLFDELIKSFENKANLSNYEENEIKKTIQVLLYEINNYIYYKMYAIRCLECVEKLNNLLGENEFNNDLNEIKLKIPILDLIASKFLSWNSNYNYWHIGPDTNSYIENLKKDTDYISILNVISILFENSNQGRRPLDLYNEIQLRELFETGLNLLDYYIQNNNDLNCFIKLNNNLNTLRLNDEIIHLDRLDDVNNSITNRLIDSLDRLIDLHLEFYYLWIKYNVNSFLLNIGIDYILSLLELFDEDEIVEILNFINQSSDEKVLSINRKFKLNKT